MITTLDTPTGLVYSEVITTDLEYKPMRFLLALAFAAALAYIAYSAVTPAASALADRPQLIYALTNY